MEEYVPRSSEKESSVLITLALLCGIVAVFVLLAVVFNSYTEGPPVLPGPTPGPSGDVEVVSFFDGDFLF